MKRHWRIVMFLIGAIAFAALLIVPFAQLPGPAELRDRYLSAVDARTYTERNITCVVTAINFDYRGIDTLGEEFILFTSIMGVLVLLRQAHEEPKILPDAIDLRRQKPSSAALRFWTLLMLAPTLLFGIYIIIHGQLTPGGGFQGGAIVASALLLVYLCDGFECFQKMLSHSVAEHAEAAGLAGFVLVGIIALLTHMPFLSNVIPLGETTELTSGGTIAWISGFTGVEVAAGMVLLLHAFLQTALTSDEKQ